MTILQNVHASRYVATSPRKNEDYIITTDNTDSLQ